MAGQAKQWALDKPAPESGVCSSSTCAVRPGCCWAESLWALFPEDSLLSSRTIYCLWTQNLGGTPSFFWRSAESLDLRTERHALLLDIQRLDPLRRVAVRLSRQDDGFSRFFPLSVKEKWSVVKCCIDFMQKKKEKKRINKRRSLGSLWLDTC